MKMNVRVFVNFDERIVVNQEGFDELADILASEMIEDVVEFDDWLSENYSISEVFEMMHCEKYAVKEEFVEWCKETAVRRLIVEDGWKMTTVEVEI